MRSPNLTKHFAVKFLIALLVLLNGFHSQTCSDCLKEVTSVSYIQLNPTIVYIYSDTYIVFYQCDSNTTSFSSSSFYAICADFVKQLDSKTIYNISSRIIKTNRVRPFAAKITNDLIALSYTDLTDNKIYILTVKPDYENKKLSIIKSDALVSSFGGYHDYSKLAILSNNYIALTWNIFSSTENQFVYIKILSQELKIIREEFPISSKSLNEIGYPDICKFDSGKFVVVYQKKQSTENKYSIFFTIFNTDFGINSNGQNVAESSSTPNDSFPKVVCLNSSEQFAISWFREGLNSVWDLKIGFFKLDGSFSSQTWANGSYIYTIFSNLNGRFINNSIINVSSSKFVLSWLKYSNLETSMLEGFYCYFDPDQNNYPIVNKLFSHAYKEYLYKSPSNISECWNNIDDRFYFRLSTNNIDNGCYLTSKNKIDSQGYFFDIRLFQDTYYTFWVCSVPYMELKNFGEGKAFIESLQHRIFELENFFIQNFAKQLHRVNFNELSNGKYLILSEDNKVIYQRTLDQLNNLGTNYKINSDLIKNSELLPSVIIFFDKIFVAFRYNDTSIKISLFFTDESDITQYVTDQDLVKASYIENILILDFHISKIIIANDEKILMTIIVCEKMTPKYNIFYMILNTDLSIYKYPIKIYSSNIEYMLANVSFKQLLIEPTLTRYILIWEEKSGAGTIIKQRIFNAKFGLISSKTIDSDAMGNIFNPKTLILHDNKYLVAYNSNTSPYVNGIIVQFYSPDGNEIGTAMNISSLINPKPNAIFSDIMEMKVDNEYYVSFVTFEIYSRVISSNKIRLLTFSLSSDADASLQFRKQAIWDVNISQYLYPLFSQSKASQYIILWLDSNKNPITQIVEKCPKGFYMDSVSNYCKKCLVGNTDNNCTSCDISCRNCSLSDHQYYCGDCSSGYAKLGNNLNICKKIDSIVKGYYYDSSVDSFKPCYGGCLLCSGELDNKCTKCKGLTYFMNSDATLPWKCEGPSSSGNYFDNIKSTFKKGCDSSCSSCVDFKNKCESCNTNYAFLKDSLDMRCFPKANPNYYDEANGRGYVLDQTQNYFLPCDFSCSTCEANSPTTCLTCNEAANYFPYIEGNTLTCISALTEGYYYDSSTKSLRRCDVSCLQCNILSTQCYRCAAGYFPLLDQPLTCKNFTPAGYSFDAVSQRYVKCDISCSGCSGTATNCLSCNSNYYPLADQPNICKNTTPEGYYLNQTTGKYSLCHVSCKRCDANQALDYCLECANGFFALNNNVNKCLNTPQDGQFINLVSKKIEDCDVSCATCQNSSVNCLTCGPSFKPLPDRHNTCKTGNIDGYYIDADGNYISCDVSCKTCENSSVYCLSCNLEQSYFPLMDNPNTCKSGIVEGYYLIISNKKYDLCDASCATCQNSSVNCLTCRSSFKPLPDRPNTCKSGNVDGYYIDESGNYVSCDVSCKTCQNQSKCLSCNIEQSYFFVFGQVNICKTGDIPGYYLNNTNKQYEFCDRSCKTCRDSATNCLSCNLAEDYFIKMELNSDNTTENISSSFKCIHKNIKVPNYFANVQNQRFEICDVPCSECTDKPNNCTKCNLEKGFFSLELTPNICLDKVNDGFYLNTNLIKKCDNSCKTCKEEAKKCTICSQGFYPKIDEPSTCLSELKDDKYFLDTKINKWNRCPVPSETCNADGSAKTCPENFFLDSEKKQCVKNCPDKFYGDIVTKSCKPCVSPCLTCTEPKKCIKCIEPFLFFKEVTEDNCIKECTEGYYKDVENKQCNKCNPSCKACKEENVCSSCSEDYFFIADKNSCEKECPDKHFKSVSNSTTTVISLKQCIQCDESCLNCTKSPTNCTSCKDKMYLDIESNKCMDKCRSGYLKNDVEKKCLKLDDITTQNITSAALDSLIKSLNVSASANVSSNSTQIKDEIANKTNKILESVIDNTDNKSIDKINTDSIKSLVKIQQTAISENVANKLLDMSSMLIESAMSGNLKINSSSVEKIFELQNIALMAQINLIQSKFSNPPESVNNKNETNTDQVENKQDQLNQIKNNINTFINSFILKPKSDGSSEEAEIEIPKMIKFDKFAVQFLKKKSNITLNSTKINANKIRLLQLEEEDPEKLAVKNNLSIPDYKACETILKNAYNISEDESLLVKNLQLDSKTSINNLKDSTASDIISLEFFNPENNEKLDSSLCSNTTMPIKIPFKENERLNMKLYQNAAVLKGVVDLYDKKSPGYHSRCFKSEDFSTGGDTSINFRRTKLYQNETIGCSPGCIYEGLDNNKYVKCNCQINNDTSMSNNSTGDDPLFAFPKLNLDISLCYMEVYNDKNLGRNLGLYTIISLTFLGLIPYFLLNKTYNGLINKRINSLIFNDCMNIDEEKTSKEKYFKRRKFKINLRSHNINKMLDLIAYNKIIINQNRLYVDMESKQFIFKNFLANPKDKQSYPIKSQTKAGQAHDKRKVSDEGLNLHVNGKNIQNLSFSFPSEQIIYRLYDGKNYYPKKIHKIKNHYITGCNFKDLIKMKKFINCNQSSFNNLKKCMNILNQYYKLEPKFKDDIGESSLIRKIKFYTLKDYEILNPYEAILYDKRSFFELFHSKMIEDHWVYNLLFVDSLMQPLWFRMLISFLFLNINFFLSAIFFTDDYIDQRAEFPANERDSLTFTLINENMKILISMLFSFIFSFIIDYITRISVQSEEKLNNILRSKNKKLIIKANFRFQDEMKKTYTQSFIMFIILNAFTLYYSVVFCSIYSKSSKAWFDATILALFIDIAFVSVCIPLIKTTVRLLIRNFRILKFLIIVDYSFFILNFLL